MSAIAANKRTAQAVRERSDLFRKLFDLAHDPEEKIDLANSFPKRVEAYRKHLTAWSAAQRALVKQTQAPAF
ncbi:MAG TPA: hypothetical protein VIZ44_08260, partial [Gaiellaceae bacterium]